MLSLAALFLTCEALSLSLAGPQAGILSAGDTLYAVHDMDRGVEVRWVRKGRLVARAFGANYLLATDTPMCIVRRGSDRLLTFWSGWASGYGREFILIKDNPPRLTPVGSFQNGTLGGFQSNGRVWEFSKYETWEALGRNTRKWLGHQYWWNSRLKRFDSVGTKQFASLPAESLWRFRN